MLFNFKLGYSSENKNRPINYKDMAYNITKKYINSPWLKEIFTL